MSLLDRSIASVPPSSVDKPMPHAQHMTDALAVLRARELSAPADSVCWLPADVLAYKKAQAEPPAPTCPIPVADWFQSADPRDARTHADRIHRLTQLRVMNQYVAHLGHTATQYKLRCNIMCPGQTLRFWPVILGAPMWEPDAPTSLPPASLFEMVVRSRLIDRSLVRALLQTCPLPSGQACWAEYDVDVCDIMLRGRVDLLRQGGHEAWLAAGPCWRSRGLLYPLAVAARYRPSVGLWLAPSQAGSELGRALSSFLAVAGAPGEIGSDRFAHAAKGLVDAWHNPEPESVIARDHLIHLMDSAAISMGVKSNGRPVEPGTFGLCAALRAFGSLSPGGSPLTKGQVDTEVHSKNRITWPGLCGRVQASFPPSMLYHATSLANRPTWGFNRLTLRVAASQASKGDVLPPIAMHFAETELACVLPIPPASRNPAYAPLQSQSRTHDLLWRLGAVALSSEVADVMLGRQVLRVVQPSDPHAVLAHMRVCVCPPSEEHTEYHKAIEALEGCVSSAAVPAPRTWVMWRLDLPGVRFAYGESALSQADLAVQRSTEGVPKRVARITGEMGGIARAYVTESCSEAVPVADWSQSADPDEAVPDEASVRRLVLAHFSATHTPAADPDTDRTLMDAVLCLTTPPPVDSTSVVPLQGGVKWTRDGIDPRYAELQQATNGLRFRDWVAMHCDPVRKCTWQCRLAAHVVHTDTMHCGSALWIRSPIDSNQSTRSGQLIGPNQRPGQLIGPNQRPGDEQPTWVTVLSTLPTEQRVLKGSTLGMAVEACYSHEPGLLPVARSDMDVHRKDMEFYHPDPQRVLVSYAPKRAQGTLHLLIFQVE